MNYETLLAQKLSSAKVKTAAWSGKDIVEGGRQAGKLVRDAAKKHAPTAAKAAVVSGAAYLGAKSGAKKKKASAIADEWGRQLAREDAAKLKTAMSAPASPLAAAGRALWASRGDLLKQVAVGRRWPVRSAGIGAAGGALIGGAKHMLKPKDPYTGQRQGSLLGSMAGGAALGGAAGYAAPHMARGYLKPSPAGVAG